MLVEGVVGVNKKSLEHNVVMKISRHVLYDWLGFNVVSLLLDCWACYTAPAVY